MINPRNSPGEMDDVAGPEQKQVPAVQSSESNNEQTVVVDDTDNQELLDTSVASDAEASAVPVRRVKKRTKRMREVTEAELMPRSSAWPFALALSLVTMLAGIAIHPILLGVGAIMVIASVIGWGLERR